jgi:hypothetical protein
MVLGKTGKKATRLFPAWIRFCENSRRAGWGPLVVISNDARIFFSMAFKQQKRLISTYIHNQLTKYPSFGLLIQWLTVHTMYVIWIWCCGGPEILH